jgi:hypothetical protein
MGVHFKCDLITSQSLSKPLETEHNPHLRTMNIGKETNGEK